MEYSHKLARSTTDTLEKLVAFIEERRRSDSLSADVAEFEKDVRALCSAVERAATTEELARFDVHAPAVRVDGGECIVSSCVASASPFPPPAPSASSGISTPTAAAGAEALCPLERRAGVIRGDWTPRAAQLATWVTAHLVPGEAEQLFGRLGGMTPSRSTLDRLPKELSERWERQRAEFEQSLRLTEEVPQEAVIVAVSLDGVMVPMKAGQRKEKRAAAAAAGKPTRGPAGYCEAACATVTVYDHERAPLHTVRMGRMPESKKATIKGMLCDELAAVAAARPELEIVAVADGARDNWRYFDRELPGAAQIADFYHAVEHLGVALASAYGEGSTRHKSQFKKLRYVLEYEAGGIDKVIRSLRHLRDRFPRRKALRREVKYFQRNRHRMRYLEFTEQGWPIGSGMVEAACKTLVTQRLKRSGMRWNTDGGQAILTFRSAAQSQRFDRAWNLVASAYRTDVTPVDNVFPFQPRRAA